MMNMMDGLIAVVRKVDGIGTVDALLCAVAGNDLAGGVMLKRIVYWHDKMRRTFYLSAKDWWEQARISESVVKRVKKNIFPGCGVDVDVKIANRGVPVTHYTLDAERFYQALATAAGLDLSEVRALMTGSSGTDDGGNSSNPPDHTADSAVSLTRTTQEIQTDSTDKTDTPVGGVSSSAEEALIADGLSVEVAGKYADLALATVEELIADSHAKQAAGEIKFSRKGYLRGALRRALQQQAENPFKGKTWKDFSFTGERVQPRQPKNVSETVDPVDARRWDAVLDQFRLQYPRTRNQIRLLQRDNSRFEVEANGVWDRMALWFERQIGLVWGLDGGRHRVEDGRWVIEFGGMG